MILFQTIPGIFFALSGALIGYYYRDSYLNMAINYIQNRYYRPDMGTFLTEHINETYQSLKRASELEAARTFFKDTFDSFDEQSSSESGSFEANNVDVVINAISDKNKFPEHLRKNLLTLCKNQLKYQDDLISYNLDDKLHNFDMVYIRLKKTGDVIHYALASYHIKLSLNPTMKKRFQENSWLFGLFSYRIEIGEDPVPRNIGPNDKRIIEMYFFENGLKKYLDKTSSTKPKNSLT